MRTRVAIFPAGEEDGDCEGEYWRECGGNCSEGEESDRGGGGCERGAIIGWVRGRDVVDRREEVDRGTEEPVVMNLSNLEVGDGWERGVLTGALTRGGAEVEVVVRD